MMLPRFRSLMLLSCLAFTACGSGGSKTAGADAELVLGTGEASYEPMSRGDHLTLHAGTQGGHQVWLSLRARGLDPERVRMTLDVTPTAPASPAFTDVELRFSEVAGDDLGSDAGAGDWIEFVGWPARILQPECAVDQPVTLEVTLEDALGTKVSAQTEIVPDPPKAGFVVECEP